jgi:2-polyprenyl-6-methoxyphenol hydroxylase-like FAD-dependent oxidoreductase
VKEATLMCKQSDVPVVIVGAGPTGVMLAIELARRGVGVRILDKQPAHTQETRAIGIHARTLEVFHQIAVVEEFLELGHRVDGLVVHTRARRSTRVRFGGLDSPYPFLLMLGQDQTQRILDQRLQRLGVTIERGVNVVALDHDADGAQLTITRTGEPREQTLLADWVVGCDGAHSIVRRQLGVPFDGDDYGQDWLMTEVNVHRPLERQNFHLFSYTAAPMVAFPMPSGRWRVILPQVPNRAGDRPPPDMDEIERLAAQRGPTGMTLTDPTLLATFRCYRRSTKTMRHGRVLVAGDAAHIHTPAGGQGMNTGLHDAFNLGWKLALVAHRQSPPALLDTYQDERLPIANSVLALTHALVKIFTVTSPRKRWLRDRLLPIVMAVPAAERRYTNRLAQLSHNYRGGPLGPVTPRTKRRSIAPGDRLPSVSGLGLGGKPVSTLDLLSSPGHKLIVLTGKRADPLPARNAIARLARFNGAMQSIAVCGPTGAHDPHAISDPDLHAHRRYHALQGQLLLVRPDGYLACRAPLGRPDIPERYLQRLTRAPDQAPKDPPQAVSNAKPNRSATQSRRPHAPAS